jgi:hypothetical protein
LCLLVSLLEAAEEIEVLGKLAGKTGGGPISVPTLVPGCSTPDEDFGVPQKDGSELLQLTLR